MLKLALFQTWTSRTRPSPAAVNCHKRAVPSTDCWADVKARGQLGLLRRAAPCQTLKKKKSSSALEPVRCGVPLPAPAEPGVRDRAGAVTRRCSMSWLRVCAGRRQVSKGPLVTKQ